MEDSAIACVTIIGCCIALLLLAPLFVDRAR